MKKVLVLFCICFMMISTFSPVCVSSASSVDYSQHISDEILAQLPLKEGDLVIPVYISAFAVDFGYYHNIDELIDRYAEKYEEAMIYVVLSQDGNRECYTLYEGEYVKRPSDSNSIYYCHLNTFLEGEVLKEIDPDIQVEYAYLFNGIADHYGIAIYYQTDLGDYVFYAATTGTYLMSAEAFFAVQKEIHDYYLSFNGIVPVGSAEMDEMDLSAYQIGSPNFNPNAPFPGSEDNKTGGNVWLIGGITLAVVLTAAAAWFFLRRRHKSDNLQV